ncbi:MAG: NFACT family protein [Candidatus Diapherotrites archaeon]
MEIEITNLTLRYLVEEIKLLAENSHINKIQTLPNQWLKIKVHTKEGTKDLIASPTVIYFTQYSIPAKMHSSGFSAFLKKHLFNRRILKIEQKGFDRVVVFEFEQNYLIFELFAKGNIILTDKNYEILMAFRKESWKDRELQKGETYKFPASKGMNPEEISFDEFKEIAKDGFGIAATLIKQINIAPFYAELICDELKIDKKENFPLLKTPELKKVYSAIQKYYVPKEFTHAKAFILENENHKLLLPANIAFPENVTKTADSKTFESVSLALDTLLSKDIQGIQERDATKKSEKGISALEFSHNQQIEAIDNTNQKIADSRRKAEIIYENYQKVDEVISKINELAVKKIPEKEIQKEIISKYHFVKSIDMKNKKAVLTL